MAGAGAGLLNRMKGRASSFGFSHGIHPPEHKELTAQLPIRRMPYPEELILPLRQHAGKPAKLIVAKGTHVERGDVLARADGWVSSPVHASAAGWIDDIVWAPHPDGSMSQAVRLRVERYSHQVTRPRLVPDWNGLTPKQVVQSIQDAGVVGLGGAAFPTHVKLAPPDDLKIDTIVLNGAECEPYLTSDHRVMVEYATRVHFGVRIMMHALGAKRAVIGIERNKPDAIAEMERTKPSDLDVTVLPLTVKYPQGAEKMLLKAVLDREVPSGKLPAHVGAIVQNVGSAATLAEVFETGMPLVERIVTVSGKGVKRPGNLIVPVGTRLRDLIAFCGGTTEDAAEFLFGGPMMGLPQRDLDVPLLKGTSGVVVLTHDEIRDVISYPCIHCGRCLDACPIYLNPSHLGDLAKAGRYDEMEVNRLTDCMLCGSCSYVCPSNIPLAQLFQSSKTALRKRKVAS